MDLAPGKLCSLLKKKSSVNMLEIICKVRVLLGNLQVLLKGIVTKMDTARVDVSIIIPCFKFRLKF